MASFLDLQVQDQIQHIKDHFMLILEEVINHPAQLQKYIPETDDQYKTVETFLSKVGKRVGCTCGSCINTAMINAGVPPELEILVDAARKEAENKTY